MKKTRLFIALITAFMTALLCSYAGAGVTQEEADRLKSDLTPMGAERAGNAEGTIPEWTGGLSEIPAGITYNKGDVPPDPFTDDKVLYTITAANMDQYKDKLNPGTIAMFKKYPDTYKLDVFQSRRTAAFPEWVYENTYKNATRATLSEDGYAFYGAYGGTPFPIPSKGEHLIYNHIVRYSGASRQAEGFITGIVSASGKLTPGGGGLNLEQWPYYEKDNTLEEWEKAGGIRWNILNIWKEPARRKGELLAVRAYLDQNEKESLIWQYMPGTRRVRRAPNMTYDAPHAGASGFITMDDAYMFNGKTDRFDWKILGKKEMYIPYNCYKAPTKGKAEELIAKGHLNPDYIRWELHRVWVVEGTLRSGKRHCYGKRVFFVDEDSWNILVKDQYDNRGELWHTSIALSFQQYDLPGYTQLTFVDYDLQKTEYSVNALMNYAKEWALSDPGKLVGDQKMFTPKKLRQLGRR